MKTEGPDAVMPGDRPVGNEDAAVDAGRRFGGLDRLYGSGSSERLAAGHACVVGIGGVGSWAAEALARSGVGRITLIDLDHVAESNINRQAQALGSTLGQAKVRAMAARIHDINPLCELIPVDDFLTPENAFVLLEGVDAVIDATDNVQAKVAMAALCRQHGRALVMAGGAGGKTDPGRIAVDDLSRTEQDPLLAKVRSRLRKEHGFSRDPKKKFGIEAVFSREPLRYPVACEPASGGSAGRGPQGLACAGYGSSVAVTASVGLFAAARAIDHLLRVPAHQTE
jgi:tRNA A37 threonylcarbamoyladenosine dehydratase